MSPRGEHRDLFLSLIFAVGILLFAGVLSSYHAKDVEATDIPTSVFIRICGNGTVEAGEVCDDGTLNNDGVYASSTATRHCMPDCASFAPYCGDGILQVRFTEQCDDGNNGGGDICDPVCMPVPPTPPVVNGSPTVGSVPDVPGATPGQIASEIPTKVVLRGKAFPGGSIKVLVDGQVVGTTQADSNADFLFSTTQVTPGTIAFSFLATDPNGVSTVMSSFIFEVLQSAVTTVANIFLPPTISVSSTQVNPGDFVTLSGYSVPTAKVTTQISGQGGTTMISTADPSGAWALQVDTKSLALGYHAAKSSFQISDSIKSGYGRAINFTVGAGSGGSCGQPDMNGDKKVNLVDFSIFLTSWNTTESKADFNCDGRVNLADFSIMLFQWTG